MSDEGLARRVAWWTAGLVVAVAVGSWVVSGPREALGAVVGGGVTIVNFLWLRWTAGRALRGGAAGHGPWRRALWLGASAARFGVLALTLGAVVLWGGVGLAGLVIALAALPITVVAAGLRESRPG